MTRTNAGYRYEHANEATTTVAGNVYTVWCNFKCRTTEAMDNAGQIKVLTNGYLSNDLSVRKAIANAFHTGTFRK